MARYIDAEEAMKRIDKLFIIGWPERNEGVGEAQKVLLDMPAADIQEVKHGKWVVRKRHEHYPSGKPYDENVCPFCKRTDHNGDGIYCGYCGAKMDQEESENKE